MTFKVKDHFMKMCVCIMLVIMILRRSYEYGLYSLNEVNAASYF